MNISYSKVSLYNTCGYKYYLQYVEKYQPNKTAAALLFGLSIDKALNYVLLRKKRNKEIFVDTVNKIFLKQMNAWRGQNELTYFKSEAPELDSCLSSEEKQELVWKHLVSLGQLMISTYINEILPLFKKVLSVQTKRKIINESEDTLRLVTDFIVELQDGRIALMDNKTSSDVDKYYGPDSVKESDQLAIYSEYEQNRLAGYIALQKKPINGKIKWTCVIDEIPEEQIEKAFNKIDETLTNIKSGKFDKNKKNCKMYGKLCEYYAACHYGNYNGLIKK